ncbi:ABC transporter substrate-binding protein [Paenibacillus sp. Leaf72]|uniref:ABC transporter substrate-binding protein n=1 Tax=Paenibacillus sp. Leaf72 TaxID=1736234 RepID=UPI0006F234B4|nr:extracellular solute-binding protein [Paenibacillus sp. Leaf72]KQO10858.1 hypothetical protein ASF12_10770 [Paenibacillus sp. Leaf72]
MKKTIITGKFLLATILFVFIIGCSLNKSPEEKVSISILYSSLSEFKNDVGDSIDEKFDDVNIRVIEYKSVLGEGMWNDFEYVPVSGGDWDVKSLIDLINKEKPDIIYFPASIFSVFINENMLQDVTDYSKTNSEVSGIDPVILEAMQTMGDGRIYFLPDSMASQAVYYNKDIFLEYGISEPADFMSWDDLFELSSKIAQQGVQDNISGLQTPNYSLVDIFLQIGKQNGLSWYDSNKNKAFFSSESWKNVLGLVIQKYKLDSKTQISDKRSSELFIDGKTAMVLDTFRLRDELVNHQEMNWSVVTQPVGEFLTDSSSSLAFQYLNGIYNQTPQSDKSREIWSYLNSEEISRNKHNANMFRYTLPVRSNLISDSDMRNLAAFYKLKPMVTSASRENDLPIASENAVKLYLFDQMQKIIKEEISIDEATSLWEVEVPAILMKK